MFGSCTQSDFLHDASRAIVIRCHDRHVAKGRSEILVDNRHRDNMASLVGSLWLYRRAAKRSLDRRRPDRGSPDAGISL